MYQCYQSSNCAASYPTPPNNTANSCPCYLAIANVPWQYFTNSYDPEQALRIGTMFPELNKPFLGRSVRQ